MGFRRAGVGRVGLAGLAMRMALAVALVLAAGSCRPSAEAVADGDDPLAALAAPAQSARYDGPYWAREAHRGSRTWRAARAFCAGHRELPNCHPVLLVTRWEEPVAMESPAGLPPLPAPPALPPALHPGEAGAAGADLAALKAWEAQLQARGKAAGGEVRR